MKNLSECYRTYCTRKDRWKPDRKVAAKNLFVTKCFSLPLLCYSCYYFFFKSNNYLGCSEETVFWPL
jgi:hypothetical protein